MSVMGEQLVELPQEEVDTAIAVGEALPLHLAEASGPFEWSL